jgi:hypothetical protein
MIKKEDLRIGNWIKDGHDFEQVTSHHIKCVELERCEYDPIELTEEILLKCGFGINNRPSKDVYIEFNPRMAILFNQGNISEMDLIQDGKFISFKHGHIKFLHQLQNLVYSLTNEELIYTP